MSLRSGAARGGTEESSKAKESIDSVCDLHNISTKGCADGRLGEEKQKVLLAEGGGHFSMVK